MLGTVLQLLWLHQRKKAISKQHWLTAIAILVLGSITLILKNPMFLKWKPTIVNLVFAAALLVSQWLGKTNIVQKMLGGVFTMPDALWRRLNLAWAIYLAFMAGLNLVIAYGFSDDFWVGFKLWGSGGCAILFFFAQAYVLRHYLNHARLSATGSRQNRYPPPLQGIFYAVSKLSLVSTSANSPCRLASAV